MRWALLLAMLAGHRRYAHITGLRGDAVRRAVGRLGEADSAAGLRPAPLHSVVDALDTPWVLHIDASIKPLYGKQEGAGLGYNPHKPGRPSHVLHTHWVSNLRLVLDVQVSPGKQYTSAHAKAGLGQLLDELGTRRPTLVRGNCGYGNEAILTELEERDQRHLLRMRLTKNVQRLLVRQLVRRTGAGSTTRAARRSRTV
jgi:hypothetical protein